jgi:YfiH family protein
MKKMKNIIEPPNIKSAGINAFFTLKQFSENQNSVKKALTNNLGIENKRIFIPIQKHTDNVHVLKSDMKPVTADAVITDRPNVLIGVIVADCVPVLIYDRNKKVIGAVHAGWKGTASGILEKTLSLMTEKFNSGPDDLLVSIGPSIKKCSYEVDADVKQAVESGTGPGDYIDQRGEKYMVDLAEANMIQSLNHGIPEINIWKSEDCTFCNPGKYYSYRYMKGSKGRQGGFIGMW